MPNRVPTELAATTAHPGHSTGGSAVHLLPLLLRHKWFLVSAALIGSLLGITAAWLATPMYDSAVSLRIDQKKSGLPVLDALSDMSAEGSELNTEMQMLRTRLLAEETTDSLGLQVSARGPRQLLGIGLPFLSRPIVRRQVLSQVSVRDRDASGEFRGERRSDLSFLITDRESGDSLAVVRAGERLRVGAIEGILAPEVVHHEQFDLDVVPHDAAVVHLRRHLTVSRPNRDANFVVVRYESADPVLASQVANTLAAKFLELRDEIQKTEARSTVVFLRQQIDTLAGQLASTEDALRAFREGNRVVSLTEEASTQVGELARLQAERDAKEAERISLARALTEAETKAARGDASAASAFRSLIAFPTLISTNAAGFLQSLNDAEMQRTELLRRRKPNDPEVELLSGRIRELELQLSSIARAYLAGLSSQVRAMDGTLARFQQQLKTIPSKELQLARLVRQNEVLVDVYKLLQTRLQEAQIAQAVEDSRVRVMDVAKVPRMPFAPSYPQYLLLGFLFGALGGAGLLFMRETLDRAVHTPEDLAHATGVSNLGLIPRIGTDRGLVATRDPMGAPKSTLMGRTVLDDSRSPVAEAYRTLRTNITFARMDDPVRTLVLTSPTPGDGKTTTAANLATLLAHQGQRVLLIDADMRRGTLEQVFGVPRAPGLSNVLVGAETPEACTHKVALNVAGQLDLMPTGPYPPNPSELIGSRHLQELLTQLLAKYDMVIFDSPPLNLVTDAAILATRVDGMVLVARAGVTDRGAVAYAADLIRKVRAPLLGTVLNDFDAKRDSAYASYGTYGYYAVQQADAASRNGNGNGAGGRGLMRLRPLDWARRQFSRKP